MPGLVYNVERDENVIRLVLENELDMRLAPDLKELFGRELADPPPLVVIDMQKVPFVDSSIIATLVYALRLIRQKGASLKIENCQPTVKDTFEITRLSESFGVE